MLPNWGSGASSNQGNVNIVLSSNYDAFPIRNIFCMIPNWGSGSSSNRGNCNVFPNPNSGAFPNQDTFACYLIWVLVLLPTREALISLVLLPTRETFISFLIRIPVLFHFKTFCCMLPNLGSNQGNVNIFPGPNSGAFPNQDTFACYLIGVLVLLPTRETWISFLIRILALFQINTFLHVT